MSLIMDAMDANKCWIPHLGANRSKHWDNLGSDKRVSSHYFGVINHGISTRIFMLDDELKKDGNVSGTILIKVLTDEFERRKQNNIPWAKVLYLQMDNGSDNKNSVIFGLGELMVRIGLFEKVKYSFLPVGHTHEDIDAAFGACSHILWREYAYTIDHVEKIWKRAWKSTQSFEYLNVGQKLTWPYKNLIASVDLLSIRRLRVTLPCRVSSTCWTSSSRASTRSSRASSTQAWWCGSTSSVLRGEGSCRCLGKRTCE